MERDENVPDFLKYSKVKERLRKQSFITHIEISVCVNNLGEESQKEKKYPSAQFLEVKKRNTHPHVTGNVRSRIGILEIRFLFCLFVLFFMAVLAFTTIFFPSWY